MTAARILIVDDDAAFLRALPETLRLRMGDVATDACDSARAALDRIRTIDYDAILADIKMPGMDGLALMAEIRTLRPNTPTLLITGHGDRDLVLRALRGGAYDFIEKPIDRDHLVASLRRAIQARQLGRRVEQQQLALERHAGELEQIVHRRTQQVHDLVGRLLLAQEEERRRVAYELHDGLAQVAAAAQQHLEAVASHYRPRSSQRRQDLEHARELARRTVGEARRVVAGLRPTTLDDFGLAAALREQVETLRSDGWQVTYTDKLGSERLPSGIESALFRVAQEALQNARRHAQTTRAHVALRRRGRTVRLEVRDWGRGFRPGAVPASTGAGERVGLPGMRERLSWLGGRCTVRSRPGAGTRIVAEVSLPAPE